MNIRIKFWILAGILAWFGRDGARAQQRQPVTSVQPDCMVFFNLTAASSGAQAAVGSTGTSIVIDNHQVGCYGWTVAYTSFGFASLSLSFQSAPDNAGGTAPGTWATVAVCGGTECLGINPNTAITSAITTTKAIAPWTRMNLTAKTGTGAVRGVLYAFKVNVVANGGAPVVVTVPGAPVNSVQYNNAGAFGGMAGTTWTDATRTLILLDGASNPILEVTANPAGDGPSSVLFGINSFVNLTPPSVSSATATWGGGISVASANGGDTSIATTGVGGSAGEQRYTTGGGGGAVSAVTQQTGGDGGSFAIELGLGGDTSGLGGVTDIAGDGGQYSLDTGHGGASANGTGGNGGNSQINLGDGGTGPIGNGSDGTFIVKAGARANAPLQQWKNNGGTVLGAMQSNGAFTNVAIAFASIGTPANGTQLYCSDCTVTTSIDDTCAGAGSGAMADRVNGAWKCRI